MAHVFTTEERRRGGLANPFTPDEAARGRSLGGKSMARSGHLARVAAKGRRTMRERRELLRLVLDLFPEAIDGLVDP